ncbi:Cell division cycle protein 123-like [Vitis vinifera]|uniref:Cell division cycle protein 123-like n=1 Tax=Vitis vinifera TaxID=29760 RepID=A0A438EBA2_VITVI|nr:Cell division cycle protein 123-like [Vitis vinifera]
MKQDEVNLCQIQEWYPKFKSISIKTLIHELPESFVEYLLDDHGPFLLPASVINEDALPNRIHNSEEEEDYQVSEGSGDEAEQPPSPPSFPELELKIKESIESLGAPNFYLALRKWYPSLRPEMEFRCFVRDRLLVGISQREVTGFYPALLEKKSALEVVIREFFMDKVSQTFELENYTFDVYVTMDDRVKLVDFNPWGAFTLPLLFTWEELEQSCAEEGHGVEFRIVESQSAVRPGLKTAVPYDYLATGPGSGWDQFLRNADQELERQIRSPEAGG